MPCRTGKLAYSSAAAAHKALRAITRRPNSTSKGARAGWHPGPTVAYRCNFCGEWHIGHTTRQSA